MDAETLLTFEKSLGQCSENPAFLDLFYKNFLASSPKVREKFANTDFEKQKTALWASFDLMLRAARDEELGPSTHLTGLAERHGASQLDIGAEYYDLWLDSLLTTVRACDPDYSADIEQAWEDVMSVGIRFLCSRYHEPPKS